MAKKWAMSPVSIDGVVDANSPTGYTQSSKEWALYSKTKAQEAATSATNAKSSETNAKSSETNASASAPASASSASASATSATNAHNSETAANSAKQAAESAGVFQDFKGATASSDGLGGKVPKPLAGQQEKFLKADGTWGDVLKPFNTDGHLVFPNGAELWVD